MTRWSRCLSFSVALIAFAGGIAGCGDDGDTDATTTVDGDGDGDGDGDDNDFPFTDVPRSTVRDGVRRDLVLVPGFDAPANPTTDDATPAELSFTQVARYRQDVDPAAPARAIVIMFPGFLGGIGSFDGLAQALIRRSVAAEEPIEVWAIDRRANLLEDLRGLDTAEATGNPEIAAGYYFGDATIDGEPFPGFIDQDDLAYMSEWGLQTHVEDLRRVIALVPEAERRDRVVLLGHSLGASFAETYAAWRFEDGTRGAEELAGLILADGSLGNTPFTEFEYTEDPGGGLTGPPGLTDLRDDGPYYFALPLFGVEALPLLEVLALRAAVAPDEVVDDAFRDSLLRTQLQLSIAVPPLTNAAALGFSLDDDTNGLSFTQMSCGEPGGGPLEEYENGVSQTILVHPASSDQTYTWTDVADEDEENFTSLATLIDALSHGGTNFPEWYFPVRLQLDLRAVAGANVPEDGYQERFGLRAFDGLLNDAPILAIPTELRDAGDYDVVRTRVAAAVGEGRPNAGATREEGQAGFVILDAPELTHVDPVIAGDKPNNPVPGAVLDFVFANTTDGTVSPTFP